MIARWHAGRARLAPLLLPFTLVAAVGLVPADTCLSHRFLEVPCPGCGFTRASLALLHGRVRESLGLHPFALPVAIGAIVWCAAAFALPAGDPRWDRLTRGMQTALAAGLVVAWILRLGGALTPLD